MRTAAADHAGAPRAVGTRMRVSSVAISRRVDAPRAWMLAMTGRTVAAWRSALGSIGRGAAALGLGQVGTA
jgi:hypothetical protein